MSTTTITDNSPTETIRDSPKKDDPLPNKINRPKKKSVKKLHCIICNINIPSLLSHSKSQKHRLKLLELVEQGYIGLDRYSRNKWSLISV